jgi:tetratricopeptide (TPR) repeat protein
MIFNIGSVMAERFMYLPVVGFVGCLVLAIEWAAKQVLDRNRSLSTEDRTLAHVGLCSFIGGAIVLLYGARTYNRNFVWNSDVTLWESAIKISPRSFRSYQSYAFALFEEFQKGMSNPPQPRQPQTRDMKPDDLLDEIIRIAEGGRPIVDQLPDRLNSSRLYLHLGMYYGLKGDRLSGRAPSGELVATAEALPYYAKSVEALEHGVPVDRTFNALNRQKELQRGKKLQDIPDVGLLQVYEYLGNTYTRLAQIEQTKNPSDRSPSLDKARDAYLYMRRLDPTNADAYVKLAQTYFQANTREYATAHQNEARSNTEQAAIALLQALLLDNSREQLWGPINTLLQQLNTEPQPAIVVVQNQPPRLDIQRKVVQSVLCSVYQSFVRIMLDCHLLPHAEYFRKAAIETGFPPSLFDDIFREFGREPPPVPPRPAQPPQGAGGQTAPLPRPPPQSRPPAATQSLER